MIRIQDVNLIYGRNTERETQALKQINLDIQDNEIIARTPELTLATAVRGIPLVTARTLAKSRELSAP